ncbi:MAG TPA: cytochrome c [Burkholderiales bacterium]|nr:cytochrome c [Burkholderiales bacterium]
MTRSTKNLILALSAVGLAACATTGNTDEAVSVKLPAETAQFKPGPNAELARTYCTICHTPDYIYMQPPLTRAVWTIEVNKMRKVFGAPFDEAQAQKIVDYLMTQNGRP